MIKIEIVVIFLIILSINCCKGQLNDNDKSATLIEYLKCDSLDNIQVNYDLIYDCIKFNKLSFPTRNVVAGKIFQNKLKKYGTFEKGNFIEIDTIFIKTFKTITADSSNFSWGEIGTTYTDYIIEFYDKNGEAINHANISYDGMLEVYPLFKTTKWGLLTLKGENELKNLMNKYTQNINAIK